MSKMNHVKVTCDQSTTMNKKKEWEEPHTHHLSVAGATLKPFSHTNASREETPTHMHTIQQAA